MNVVKFGKPRKRLVNGLKTDPVAFRTRHKAELEAAADKLGITVSELVDTSLRTAAELAQEFKTVSKTTELLLELFVQVAKQQFLIKQLVQFAVACNLDQQLLHYLAAASDDATSYAIVRRELQEL